MVRLKEEVPVSEFHNTMSFNSKMVRLKVDTNSKGVMMPHGFNSKMVRLKEFVKQIKYNFDVVSIPKWYD